MTSPALLRTYRTIRDVVEDIRQTATAVDEHLSRFQIYGLEDELGQAMEQAECLARKLEALKSELRGCARKTSGKSRRETRDTAPSPEIDSALVGAT